MPVITLKQAAAWCGGTVEKQYETVEFLGANNDTRILLPGQLFIVLKGARDGHDFIPAAFEKGAAAVLCSRKVGDYPAIYVEDPRIALGQIAAQALKNLGCKTVGVTGSVGKSTTKEMIAKVLESTYRVSKTPANHNNDIGMPMAILAMPETTQVAVLEMGMNHFREIAYLSQIGRPDVAVIINIGTMHIEFLGSREGICQAKLEILEGMDENGKLLVNGGDDMLKVLPITPVQQVIPFGLGANCQVRAENVRQEEEMLCFRACTPAGEFPVEMQLEGEHFVSDAMAAVAVGLELGVDLENIRLSLNDFRNMAGRQEIFAHAGMTIIRDCYNAGPESMAAALNVLGNRKGRQIAVVADMLELGDCAPAEHYRLGTLAARKAKLVFAYGPNASHVARGALEAGMARENVHIFETSETLAQLLAEQTQAGDVILFKASHGMHLDRVVDAFLTLKK